MLKAFKVSPPFKKEYTIEAGASVTEDFTVGYSREREYVPFNVVLITNLSSQDLLFKTNSLEQIVPAKSSMKIEDEPIFRYEIENLDSSNATDKKVYVTLKRDITTKMLLMKIAGVIIK